MQNFGQQSQRWYFNIGLPTSAYVTSSVDATTTNQITIEKSHEKLMKDYPNAVIICFLEIKSVSQPWSLEYDSKIINGGVPNTFKLFDDSKKPDGTPVYNLPEDWKEEYNTIDVTDIPNAPWDEWQPVCVYTAYENAADDLDSFGTH